MIRKMIAIKKLILREAVIGGEDALVGLGVEVEIVAEAGIDINDAMSIVIEEIVVIFDEIVGIEIEIATTDRIADEVGAVAGAGAIIDEIEVDPPHSIVDGA
jgi:hypothetical protein